MRAAVLGLMHVCACAAGEIGEDAGVGDGSTDVVVIAPSDGPPDACVPRDGGERCNGVDDDCDGMIDEGFPGVGVECDVGVGACERSGFTICDEDGVEVVCGAHPGDPTGELCGNAIDENCNGVLDDGLGLGGPCDGPDSDACAEGTTICGADGRPACMEVGTPHVETCNGADDDCDGMVDEGIPPGVACDGSDLDGCAEGNLVCSGAALVCSDTTSTIAEICNGVDDDCQGGVDEDWPQKGSTCQNGVGACVRSGTRICNAAGTGLTCDAVPGAPGRELCGDGVDDDCSGGADPTCPPNDQPAGAIDVSAGGTFTVELAAARDDRAGTCAGTGGRDVFYQLTLPAAEVVYLDTFASNFDTVLSIRQGTCASATTEMACSDDECVTTRSQLARALGAGVWCIVAEQFSSATTAGSLSLRVVRGGRSGTQVALGTSTQTGDTCAAGSSHVTTGGCDDSSQHTGADRGYWFTTCSGSRTITARTCGSATHFDTIVYLRSGSALGADLACADDGCATAGTCDGDVNVASSITTTISAAGLYWIIVDGFDSATNCDRCGRYSLSLTL